MTGVTGVGHAKTSAVIGVATLGMRSRSKAMSSRCGLPKFAWAMGVLSHARGGVELRALRL